MWEDCKKYDGEKTTAGWMCGRRNKDRASREVRTVGIYFRLVIEATVGTARNEIQA